MTLVSRFVLVNQQQTASPFYEEITPMSRFFVVNQKCTVQLRLWDGYFLLNQKHTVQQCSSPIHEQTNLKSRIS